MTGFLVSNKRPFYSQPFERAKLIFHLLEIYNCALKLFTTLSSSIQPTLKVMVIIQGILLFSSNEDTALMYCIELQLSKSKERSGKD